MSCQNACGYNMGDCPVQASQCRRYPWYCKFIKPLFTFVVSVMLAISMSHLCEKYSASNTFQMIHSDLSTLRNNLNSLSNEVRSLTDMRDELQGKFKEISCVMPKISEAILYLRHEVSEGIDSQTRNLLKAMSPDNLRKFVQSELQIYDADKTGKTDYALESSGGAIISTRDTETYEVGAPVLTLLGIPICTQQNTPRAIIQTGVLPGECWAIKGDCGSVVIKLLGYVRITGFSLEHISPMISPTGDTSTAPREFSVWALLDANDKNGFLLGRYTYDNSGPPIQFFEVQHESNTSYELVELKIHSNSGNSNYTCIYRIRVHGTLTSYTKVQS